MMFDSPQSIATLEGQSAVGFDVVGSSCVDNNAGRTQRKGKVREADLARNRVCDADQTSSETFQTSSAQLSGVSIPSACGWRMHELCQSTNLINFYIL